MTEGSVEVSHFARVFVSDPGRIPPQADAYKSERGHYYRLGLDNIDADASAALVQKASRNFEKVEVVGQVIEDGEVSKERRYVDDIHEVPDGHNPERGPQGGVYYETDPQADFSGGSADPDVGEVSEEVGYSGEPVLAVQFEDVREGDRIAFETPDGERDMGEVVATDADERLVTVESGNGTTEVAAAPLEGVEEKEDGGVTSGTAGVHSARYSPSEDDEKEEDIETAGGVSKDCDGHHEGPEMAEGYRLEENEVLCEEDGEVYDINSDIESSEPLGECPGCGEDLSHLVKSFAKDDGEGVWTYYYGPNGGEGWMNMETGEIRYQKERPGEAPEDAMVEGDWLADGWGDPPEDITELSEGQHVEFYDEDSGEYYEGDIEILDDEGEYARIDGKEENGIIGPSGPDELTAVEEHEGAEETGDVPEDWESVPHDSDFLESLEPGDPIIYEDHGGTQYESQIDYIDQGDAIGTEEDHLVFPDKMDAWVPEDAVEQPEEEGAEPSEETSESTEPTDLLDEAGVDIGDQFEYEGMQMEVVGTTSMMADGDPSHIEAAPVEGEVTQPLSLHPNSIPEDAGGGEPEGSEEVAEDAVGEAVETGEMDEDVQDEFVSDEQESDWTEWSSEYDMDEYDPSDVEEWGNLGDFGFPSGVTAHNMEVGALPEWEEGDNRGLVFKTQYGPDGEKTDLGHRQMVTYTVGDALGGQMPQHVGHPEEDGYVAAEGVEGEDIGAAPNEYLEKVEEDDWYDQAATQIILGNNDAHSQNVKVTPDGDLVFHDIDHSAGDITSDFVGNKPHYDDAIDRVLGELARSGEHVVDDTKEEMKQKMLERAQEKAQELTEDGAVVGEAKEAIKSAYDYDSSLANNVGNNIQNLATGDVSWQ